MRSVLTATIIAGLASTLACGGGDSASESAEGTSAPAPSGEVSFEWPASLAPFGDGYPAAGDPCRKLGESEAVIDYLDHTATLVGCPGAESSEAAQALLNAGGKVILDLDGVTVLSLPNETGGEAASTDGNVTGTFSGTLTGNDRAQHTFAANEGQTINVSLKSEGTMYFNVPPPGGGPADAIFVGSQAADGNFWAGVAPASGEYTPLLYMMGNDPDSGAERGYTIEAIAE